MQNRRVISSTSFSGYVDGSYKAGRTSLQGAKNRSDRSQNDPRPHGITVEYINDRGYSTRKTFTSDHNASAAAELRFQIAIGNLKVK